MSDGGRPFRSITYVRHAQQTSHRVQDPPLKAVPAPGIVYIQGQPVIVPYDYIITSPYLRCRSTARAINEKAGKPIFVDVRLSEYQAFKGKSTLTMDPSSLSFGPIPFVETWSDVVARIDAHWEYILTFPGNILIVTHGIIVNAMYEKLYHQKLFKRGRDVPFTGGFSIRI